MASRRERTWARGSSPSHPVSGNCASPIHRSPWRTRNCKSRFAIVKETRHALIVYFPCRRKDAEYSDFLVHLHTTRRNSREFRYNERRSTQRGDFLLSI